MNASGGGGAGTQGAAGSFSLTSGPIGGHSLPETSLKKDGEGGGRNRSGGGYMWKLIHGPFSFDD
jgi:hypothetical protein